MPDAGAGAGIGTHSRVTIARPRLSPRILHAGFERDTALDFEVELDVDGRCFEGSVTLYDPHLRGPGKRSGRWAPCRSTSCGTDRGWLHGQLEHGIGHARAIAGAQADDVERMLILALSGADWPDPVWWFEAESQPRIVLVVSVSADRPRSTPGDGEGVVR